MELEEEEEDFMVVAVELVVVQQPVEVQVVQQNLLQVLIPMEH